MAELRWNPLLGTWTMVNSQRQQRPTLPQGWCPFCPGEGKKVPAHYDVLKYDNDFPILTPQPGDPDPVDGGLYRSIPNYGKAEVILYSEEHDRHLWQLPVSHISKLVDLWDERFNELSRDPNIHYVFIFENRGEEVGATISHPHGQIYAFPYIPQKIDVELNNCRDYFQEHEHCLICDMNREETRFARRIITENNHFLAYLPFFTDYPFGVFVVSKRHLGCIGDMNREEKQALADILKRVTGAFDQIYGKMFPYMMNIHQTPTENNDKYTNSEAYYHFHIEFYPPLRSENRIKFYASSEMGAWATANPLAVEDTAQIMREALRRFLDSTEGRSW